jgi:hypothetical protein
MEMTLMKRKTIFRLFFIVLIATSGLLLFSYNKSKASNSSDTKECTDDSKSCQKKVQSEYILIESLTRDLLGNNG